MNHKKDMHNLHDKSYKDLFSKKEIALDLFKSQLKKEWTEKITEENLKLINKSFVTSDYSDTECDLVYEAEIGESKIIFYILLEFQSSVDYTMPVRLLFYMCEILREYVKNKNHKKYDKNIKVPAILPIVLYNGREVWDVPTEFRKIIYNEELFGNNIINFEYDVIDVNNGLKKEELLESKNVSAAIFLLDQKIDALEFLQRIKAIALFFEGLTETETRSIKHWIRNTIDEKLAVSAIKILESDREDVGKMVANNAFILTEMKEEAEKEGRQKGIIEGRLEGIREGKLEGKLEGVQDGIGLAKNIFKLNQKGYTPEEIAKEMKISVEEVRLILE